MKEEITALVQYRLQEATESLEEAEILLREEKRTRILPLTAKTIFLIPSVRALTNSRLFL